MKKIVKIKRTKSQNYQIWYEDVMHNNTFLPHIEDIAP